MARKILLADDSVTAQNMGRKILSDAGYEVVTVNNGSAALKKVADAKPDVIVLDVYMPGYSGLEVCQRLKEVGETARIPILLTVGKLEPFKPEEAKRVRADAFIVKPFEASELLSALSKLEDKVVPRAETHKPGRFARAIAAVEEGRYDKTMAAEEDTGWKNRIAFPHAKKEKAAEQEFVDEPGFYNPVNTDLRTFVERPEHKADTANQESSRVDLGALAQKGLPKDVTPEEIAALAAAAARIKGTETQPTESHPAKESRPLEEGSQQSRLPEHESKAASEPKQGELQPEAAQPVVIEGAATAGETTATKATTEEMSKEEPAPVAITPTATVEASASEAVTKQAAQEACVVEPPAEKPPESESELPSFAAAPSADGITPKLLPFTAAHEDSGNGLSGQVAPDEPMTLAAAGGAELATTKSRWMAIPVALPPEEAGTSLELEMQKTYAALAAAEMATVPQKAAPESQPVAVAELPAEAPPVAPVSELPQPAPVASVQEAEPATSAADEAPVVQAAVKEFETVAVPQPEVQPAVQTEPAVAAEPESGLLSALRDWRAALFSTPSETPVAVETKEAGTKEAETKEVETKDAETKEGDRAVESVVAETEAPSPQGVAEPVPNEPEAEQKREEPEQKQASPQPPIEETVPAPAGVSSTAPEAETAAPVPVSEVPAEPPLAEHISAPATKTSEQAESSEHAESSAGGIDDMAKKEREVAASTAAAWASWRRIRETGSPKAQPATESPKAAEEAAAPPLEKDEAAMAVAAGAEKAPVEVAAEAESESAEIASIVDSVLADLRPKIVAEISKKLGKKK